MGKRYLISEQQFKIIKEELKAGYGKTIKSIETRQEIFSSSNNILLDVGFIKSLFLYSRSYLKSKVF